MMTMKLIALAAAAALLTAPTVQAAPPPPKERIATLIVYGNDPCPRSSEDEIVVCARQPESEH